MVGVNWGPSGPATPGGPQAATEVMSTFKQQRADIFYDVMLDDSAFAEVITVIEPGKADRQIYAKRSSDDADLAFAQQYVQDSEDVLLMRVGRNEAHNKGGIEAPTLGLA